MHSLLRRQLKKFFSSEEMIPEDLQPFLSAVNEAYEQSDKDREMLERSLEISSDEMRESYEKLQALHDKLEERIKERTAELSKANSLLQAEISERQQIEVMQDAVYRIAQAAEEIQSLQELYPKIHQIISEVMPAENFFIALSNDEKDVLSYVYYVDEEDAFPPGTVRTERGMSAYILRTGVSLLCDQTTFEDLERRGEVELYGPPSPIWLGVPLSVLNKTIGVMAVQHYSDPHAYGLNEKRILEFVSTQVARAIERKRIEEELRTRETRYGALIRHSVDNISLLSADGRLLYENSTVIRPLGYPEGTFLGLSLFELVHPDDLPGALQTFQDMLDTPGVSRSWILRLRHADGIWRWMEGTATNLLREPAVQAIVLNYRDVTERMQTRAALDRQNRILSALHETTLALMGHLELSSVLQTIVLQAARLVDTPDGYLYLADPGQKILVVEVGIGIFQKYKGFQIQPGEGMAGWVFQTGKPFVVDDYHHWQNRSVKFDDTVFHAVVGVPLVSRDKIVGVIGLSHQKPGREFSEEDVELLTRFAQLASIALENASLHTLLQKELTARNQAEAHLRRLTDNMLDVITQIDAEGIIRYASPSHKWVLGLDADGMLGHYIFERLHPDDVADALAVFSQSVIEGKTPGAIAFRYQHKDGRYLWMECVGNVLTNSEGQFAGAVLSSRDITKRKEIEAALRESEHLYRLLAENASDVIWIRNLNLDQVYISPAIEKLRGYTVKDALTHNLDEILTPASAAYARRFFEKMLAFVETIPVEKLKNEHRTLELELLKNDSSTVWTESQVTFLLDEQGKPNGILGVTRDITERRRAADELRRLNSELEKRVEERTSELVAEISERLRIESALRESEERYALAVRGANDGLWDWNLATNEIYFSPRWKTMLGYTEGEIKNRPEEWLARIHPNDLHHVQAALSMHLKGESDHFESEYRILDAKRKYRWMLSRGLAVQNEDGIPHRMAGSQTDITDRKQAEERLAHDALHDSLTGLPNRTLFVDRLNQKLEHCKRHKDNLFAVLFLDLDRFKVINDSLGHSVGDQFLITTAQRLQSCLRPEDTISRFGGDEFAILLEEIRDVGGAIRVAERIQSRMKGTTLLGPIHRSSTASIGITIYNANYSDSQEMLRDADSAMYRAKEQGGGRYQVFDIDMYKNALALLKLEAELKRAVENCEWQVHYQPIISLKSGCVAGVEALVRWKHPQRGIVSPMEFIPAAEDSGLIIQIGEYVLQEACRQARVWQEAGYPDFWVSVNLSARQFQDQNLVGMVKQALNETGLDGTRLRLEVTETIAMQDIDYSVKILNELNKLGIQLSLDDFGNGYSSLGYLKRFPLKVLKIDRSFIHDLETNKNSEAITSAIISMGHALSLEVVAEGVETMEQLGFLKERLCNEVQGFLFSKPAAAEEIEKILKDRLFVI